MRISSLHVSGSKTLKNGGISELDIAFVSPIAIILGTNGCGKSLTLSYLDPTPASTTTFENWGRRDVVYETERGKYLITTDYSCQSSPHKFIDPDGENLNVGQTARMQEQLCETELGLNNFTIGLMMNRPFLVKRTEGQRRAFLMNITPTPIGFILDRQKDVERKIRDANANISRLNERKLQLEQDLLAPEELQALEHEEQNIQKYLEQIQRQLHIIDYEDKNAPRGLSEPDTNEIDLIRKKVCLIWVKARLNVALGVEYGRLPEEMARIETEVSQRKGIVEVRSDQIIETRQTLSQTEERIRALGIASEYQLMERRVAEIMEEIDLKEKTPLPRIMISREELERCEETVKEVESALSSFLEVEHAIYSRQKLSIAKMNYSRRLDQSKRVADALNQVQGEREELELNRGSKLSDIPKPCSGMECPLYRGCSKRENRHLDRLKSLETKEAQLLHTRAWLDKYFEIAKYTLAVQADYHEKLKVLWDYTKNNPVLANLLRRPGILVTLRNSPIKIFRDMCADMDQIAWAYRKNDLQAEVSSLSASISQYKAAGEGSRLSLEQSIQKEEKRLSDQITGLEKVEKEIISLRERGLKLASFQNDMNELDTLEVRTKELWHIGKEWIKKQIRNETRRALMERQTAMLSRIGDIRKVIRDQNLLKSRYDEEVISQLNRLEKERAVLVQVCHELTMAPREYMVPFVNKIIAIMNDLIRRYWTQKIEFIPWTTDEDLNYQFPHMKNGNLVKDMDFGSEGERDLFTLLSNLAIRIVREKTNLPLCLDEVGRTFDEKHKQNLVKLLTHVMDQKWATQMIIVNHDPMVHEGFLYSDVIVLNAENIHTPERYNEYVSIS